MMKPPDESTVRKEAGFISDTGQGVVHHGGGVKATGHIASTSREQTDTDE